MLINELLIRQKDNLNIAIKQKNDYITYSDWYKNSEKLSEKLNSIIGDNSIMIGLYLPNSINYAVSYFGILFSKRIVIPIDINAKYIELISTVKYCEIDVIVTDTKNKDYLVNTFNEYSKKIILLIVDSDEIIEINKSKELIEKSSSLIQRNYEDDVAIMLHTSGTTNNPKRVMLTHKNIICNIESNIESLNLNSDDVVLISLPMYFGYCNTAQFLTHVYLGSKIVILGNMFFPKIFFEIIQNEKITNFTAVPSMLMMLSKYKYKDSYDISSLRYICFGGSKMPIDSLNILINKFNTVGFVQTYGQTECSPRVTALLPKFSKSKLGSVGKPIPNVSLKIVDENCTDVDSNTIGELIVSGNNVMKGYYKQDELTKNVIKNGWIFTGDLGYFDEDGFVYIVGRKKNIIITGGINVYPEEIEYILLEHPNILDVCIVGEEDELLIEVPVAKVVINNHISEEELKKYCMDRIAEYKVPRRFDFVSELSKTYNGKIKRY